MMPASKSRNHKASKWPTSRSIMMFLLHAISCTSCLEELSEQPGPPGHRHCVCNPLIWRAWLGYVRMQLSSRRGKLRRLDLVLPILLLLLELCSLTGIHFGVTRKQLQNSLRDSAQWQTNAREQVLAASAGHVLTSALHGNRHLAKPLPPVPGRLGSLVGETFELPCQKPV